MPNDEALQHIRIGERGLEELERAMTAALAPLLGQEVQVQITKVTRCEDTVTGLEIEAVLDDEEDMKFAIG